MQVMKKCKMFMALMLVVVFAISAAGCGTSQTNKAADTKKILRFGTMDAKAAIDMQKTTFSHVMSIADQVIETVLTTDNDLKLQPVLLKEMPKISSDGLTYTFELKQGIKFHNGEVLKSSDVKYSYERLLKEGLMSNLIDMIKGADKVTRKEAISLEGFKIIDDMKFEITLAYPYVPFLAAISTPYCAIYPEKATAAAGKDWGIKTLIGTGPFKFKEYTQGKGVVLVKNTDYHGKAANLDEIQYKFIPDTNTMVMEYEKGNIDVMLMDSTLYPTYANDAKLKDQIHKFTPLGMVYLNPNNKDEKLKDVRVREALSYAIDRGKICKELLHGTATPATTFIPPGLDGYNKDAKLYEYNPEKAKKLLADAGYKDGIELEASVAARFPTLLKVLTAIQAQVKPAGINLKVTSVDNASFTDMSKNGKIQLGLGNWYIDYVDPDGMIYQRLHSKITKNSYNLYSSPEFDKMLDDARVEADKAKRTDLYKKADAMATRTDFAAIPIYNESMFYMSKPYLKSFKVTSAYRVRFADSDIDLAAKNAK